MKKIIALTILTSLIFFSCSSDNSDVEKSFPVTLKFTHNWDGIPVTSSDFNNFKFTTANGESVSIERLRYVVSRIAFQEETIPFFLNTPNRNLINLEEDITTYHFVSAFKGANKLSFTFGFTDEENQDGIYQDLNTANFNVPSMLGGGYHYMQFDGKYKDTNNQDAPFNYHAIRAVDKSDPNNLVFQDTSFFVDLGNIEVTGSMTIEIKMNIAEWFKNPNTWDLNQLNTVLMPNFNAQKLMSANGKTVFSLGAITQ